MPTIANTAAVPDVAAGFHLLEIEEIETVEGTVYGDPDTPETRLRVQLRVRTPGVSDDSFVVWMSAKLGPKATFGGIAAAILGAPPKGLEFDTDALVGRRFRHMVGHNDAGWPKLVPGTAAPESTAKSKQPKPSAAAAEPPF